MTRPEGTDGPLYVPAEFQEAYLTEARRRVAASRGGLHALRRATRRAYGADTTRRRLVVAVLSIHALAAIVALAFAALTATWLIGLAVVAFVAASAVVVARVSVVVYERTREPRTVPDRR